VHLEEEWYFGGMPGVVCGRRHSCDVDLLVAPVTFTAGNDGRELTGNLHETVAEGPHRRVNQGRRGHVIAKETALNCP